LSDEQDGFSLLAEHSQLVEEFGGSPAWELVEDYAKYLLQGDQRRILQGECKDWAEYQRLAGRLEGAQLVLKTPKILRGKLEADRARMVEPKE
jgi:hypothetical protein